MDGHTWSNPLVERWRVPSVLSFTLADTPRCTRIHDVAHLENCIMCCERLVKEAIVLVTNVHEHVLDSDTVLNWWQRLEAEEGVLMDELEACDGAFQGHSLCIMCLLSCGNALVAQMQVLRQRLLGCLLRNTKTTHREQLARWRNTNTAEVASAAFLVDDAKTLGVKCREREKQLVDHTMAMQRTILLIGPGETETMLEVKQQQGDGEEKWSDSLQGAITFSGDVVEKLSVTAPRSGIGGDSRAATVKDLRVGVETEKDLQLINTLLKCAFTASAYKHALISANFFAVVLQLLATKCYALEELMTMTYSQLVARDEASPDGHGTKEEKWEASTMESWASSFLSEVCPEVLPPRVMVVQRTAAPSCLLSRAFVSLLYNTAYSLWQKGCVEEAHHCLCAVNLGCLENIAAEDAEDDVAGSCIPLAWEYVALYCAQAPHQAHTRCFNNPGLRADVRKADDVACCCRSSSSGGGGGSGGEEKEQEKKGLLRLRQLMRRVACLRDLSAIILSCITPHDVLYILVKFCSALQWQRRRVMGMGVCVPQGNGDADSAKESQVDATAEVLVVLGCIVECYLSRRAAHVFLNSSAPSSSSLTPFFMTADATVRHVCDELICFLSSGEFSGLHDVEEQTLSSLRPLGCDDDCSEAQVSKELLSQVLGTTLSFASSFWESPFFQNALSAAEKRAALQDAEAEVDATKSRWLGWSASLANGMHDAARFIMKGVSFAVNERGKKKEEEEEREEGKRDKEMPKRECAPVSDRQLADFLLPMRSAVTKTISAPEDGSCTLWFPSNRCDDGLPLLLEEAMESASRCDDEAPYSDAEHLALRLLVIACRYSNIQRLLGLHQRDREELHWEDDNTLLQVVVPRLDRAIHVLTGELDRQIGPVWLTLWRQRQRDLNASRTCIFKLLGSLALRLPYLHETPSPHGVDRFSYAAEEAGAMEEMNRSEEGPVKIDYSTSAICAENARSSGGKGYGEENERDEVWSNNGGTGDAWDSSVPIYTPPLRLDLSALTWSSPEALLATEQLTDIVLQHQAEEGETGDFAANDAGGKAEDIHAHSISLLSPAARQLLHMELPVAWQFMSWRLIYSTRFHGSSFSTMLACSQREADVAERRKVKLPMLLVLELVRPEAERLAKDEVDARLVVGACLSDPLHLGTRRFYGSSETFVFQMLLPSSLAPPKLRTHRATGANQQFIRCTSHTLAIGGGGGCSLFFDGTTIQGSTAACATFASPPLTHWCTSSSSPSPCMQKLSSSLSAGERTSELPPRGNSTASYSFDVQTVELLVMEA